VLVRGGTTFAEIFEAELNCTDVPHARGAWSRPLTAPLFVFERPHPAVRVASVGMRSSVPPLNPPLHDSVAHVHAQVPAHAQDRHAPPFTESPTTRKIALSPLERRALVALNDLGAGLGESPSPSTLRRAFKRLARRYHPDRHPGSSAAEQERLARVFVEATGHYRVLASALAPHAGSA
jgi:hypothetical protein